MDSVHADAVLSPCRRYRLALWRTWDPGKPYVLFIGLNPSTADESHDDPTLTRCIQFARDWGFGGVCTANLFTFRATDPADMKKAEDPVGPEADLWLEKLSAGAGVIIAAWGNDGAYLDRAGQVRRLLRGKLHYLKLNKSGQPAHPLYLKASLMPVPWKPDTEKDG